MRSETGESGRGSGAGEFAGKVQGEYRIPAYRGSRSIFGLMMESFLLDARGVMGDALVITHAAAALFSRSLTARM